MKRSIYYTDGGCEPNPGNGVWAFVLVDPRVEESGFEPDTTNNRMEMMAVIKAIEHAMESSEEIPRIYSDSQYVVNGFNEWMENWRRKGWRKKGGDIKNIDLWKRLWELRHNADVEWIRGHSDNEFNELADELVRSKFESVTGKQMQH